MSGGGPGSGQKMGTCEAWGDWQNFCQLEGPLSVPTRKKPCSYSNNIFLWHESEDINKTKTRTKTLTSIISGDSNFTISSLAWLCVFHCSSRLLCWIKSCVWDFLLKLLLYEGRSESPGNHLVSPSLGIFIQRWQYQHWVWTFVFYTM